MLADLEGALDVEVDPRRRRHRRGDYRDRVGAGSKRRLLPGRKVSIAGILLCWPPPAVALGIAALTGDDEARGGGRAGAPPRGADDRARRGRGLRPRGRRARSTPRRSSSAIDGNPDTPWTTETLRRRPGLDAVGQVGRGPDRRRPAEPVAAREMTITSDHRRLVRRDLRRGRRPARRPRRLGRADRHDHRRRRARRPSPSTRPRESVLPDLDHGPRRERGRLRRRDRRDRADQRLARARTRSRARRAWRSTASCTRRSQTSG